MYATACDPFAGLIVMLGAVVYPDPGLVISMATRLPAPDTTATPVAVTPDGGAVNVIVGRFEWFVLSLITSTRLTLPAVIDALAFDELMYFSDPTPSE